VDVEEALGALGAVAAQHGPGIRLVRPLVLREPDVPVQAEDRAPVAAERQVECLEPCREIADQIQQRRLDLALVDPPVLLEPRLVLVEGERLQKSERLRAEAREGRWSALRQSGPCHRVLYARSARARHAEGSCPERPRCGEKVTCAGAQRGI
jgi:hypothetical protein